MPTICICLHAQLDVCMGAKLFSPILISPPHQHLLGYKPIIVLAWGRCRRVRRCCCRCPVAAPMCTMSAPMAPTSTSAWTKSSPDRAVSPLLRGTAEVSSSRHTMRKDLFERVYCGFGFTCFAQNKALLHESIL